LNIKPLIMAAMATKLLLAGCPEGTALAPVCGIERLEEMARKSPVAARVMSDLYRATHCNPEVSEKSFGEFLEETTGSGERSARVHRLLDLAMSVADPDADRKYKVLLLAGRFIHCDDDEDYLAFALTLYERGEKP